MRSLIEVQRKLLPELLSVMQKRYQILQYIRLMQPIGRRNLAVSLGLTERVLRSEVTFLKEQDLIDIYPSGMTLTNEGELLLAELEEVMKEVSGLRSLETTLKEAFSLSEVVVVSGDSDQSPWVKNEMGRASVSCIKERLVGKKNTVAVTGGTTLAAVAEMMTPDLKHLIYFLYLLVEELVKMYKTKQIRFVLRWLKGHESLSLLYVPDQVSDEIYQSMIDEP